MENMSSVPYYAEQMRWGNKYGNSLLIDGLAKDGLTDVYDGKAMGHAAELCASTCGISREEQDAFAIESYHRAQDAWKSGRFKDEVVPVEIKKKGETQRIEQDEEPFNVKFDKIPGLKPAFLKEGTVTAANASTMNDGAAALILVSEEKLKQLALNLWLAFFLMLMLNRRRNGLRHLHRLLSQSREESRFANGRH